MNSSCDRVIGGYFMKKTHCFARAGLRAVVGAVASAVTGAGAVPLFIDL